VVRLLEVAPEEAEVEVEADSSRTPAGQVHDF